MYVFRCTLYEGKFYTTPSRDPSSEPSSKHPHHNPTCEHPLSLLLIPSLLSTYSNDSVSLGIYRTSQQRLPRCSD